MILGPAFKPDMHTVFPSVIDENHKLQLVGVVSSGAAECGDEQFVTILASVKSSIEWLRPFIGIT